MESIKIERSTFQDEANRCYRNPTVRTQFETSIRVHVLNMPLKPLHCIEFKGNSQKSISMAFGHRSVSAHLGNLKLEAEISRKAQ